MSFKDWMRLVALTRLQLKSNRSSSGHFHNAQTSRSKMGYRRAIFSALSILFGTFMYYIMLHYVPALANPRKILKFKTETQSFPPQSATFDIPEASIFEKVLGPYYGLFTLDRAYMRSGETIRIKYDLPQTATAQLDIVQCQRIWAVEIFNCKVISQFGTQKGPGKGIATFKLDYDGFYHFRHKIDGVNEGDVYRLLWERD